MEVKYYYDVDLPERTEYAACRYKIKWNIELISGSKQANGLLVQRFSRKGFPSNAIIEDTNYYEAWKYVNGICEEGSSDYDDSYAIGYSDYTLKEELLDVFIRSAGIKGRFEFKGYVWWIPITNYLYKEIEQWPRNNIQAGDLRSVSRCNALESVTPLFVRNFEHEWDLQDEDKLVRIAREILLETYPENSTRLANIEANIKELKISDNKKNELKRYLGLG